MGKFFDEMKDDITTETNMFNELAILIVDRERFEKFLMASNGGQIVKANPLLFMLSKGGNLPYFDVLSTKQATVSENNEVWGFYGQQQYGNVIVNGKLEEAVYYDYYRVYAMNSAYIYQITLSYVPGLNHPRTTWDQLVDTLSSLRIVSDSQSTSE
jgi:hypothetical protein